MAWETLTVYIGFGLTLYQTQPSLDMNILFGEITHFKA